MSVGLHPASTESPAGRKGSITIGFEVPDSISNAVAGLKAKGVRFTGAITDDTEVKAAYFADPDGNEMYLVEAQGEWKDFAMAGSGT